MPFRLPRTKVPAPVAALVGFVLVWSVSVSAAERPNILLIMADDLGYSDLGCYGSEIETPVLDALAANGLRYTSFYNTARCWPSRGAMLTGYYAQQIRRDAIPGVPNSGNARGVRPAWAPLLPELLKQAGYRSYHSGKWHLDGEPLKSGFDRSYETRDQNRFFSPQTLLEEGREIGPISREAGYYATIGIADHAVRCLKHHAEHHADNPFFEFLAFTSPHFPLQALPEDITKYEQRYLAGWDSIRAQRWERLKQLDIAPQSLSEVEQDLGPPYHFPDALPILGPGEVNRPLPWDSLGKEQKLFQARKMAIHAAMIDRMDREIGRVLEQIKSMGAFENTLILFVSDNGASAEIMVRGDGHDRDAPPGSAATYLCLGPGWSTVCNTPFRRHKTWVHEGGSATPGIVHWPRGISAKGELRRAPVHILDFVPTVLELAGIPLPEVWNGEQVPPSPGRSLVPTFAGDRPVENRESLWWCHDGHRAVRKGQYKLVASKNDPWELYDMMKDRAEQNNLASYLPEIVRELEAEWNRIRDETIEMLSLR